jgi:23S rRNA (guanosine2251-2'-O)-methyltransferase
VGLTDAFAYADLDRVMDRALKNRGGNGLLIAADHITDEGNLGALIRTAVFYGADGLVLPKDRSAAVSGKVLKRSSGTYVHLPVSRVVNLARALDLLARRGFWIVGAAGDGSESIYRFDWNRDLVLVLGNEMRGLGRSVRQRCHQVVRIPSPGLTVSLNVSVAGGVILSEIYRQRLGDSEPI